MFLDTDYFNWSMNVQIIKGDISTMAVDAIVNSANTTLLGGEGVDGAIHKRAGKGLLEECKTIRREQYTEGLPPGKIVVTKGYNLAAQYIIHTVGPVYNPAMYQDHLMSYCFKNPLDAAEKLRLRSIAFPAISTGAYKYPVKKCAEIARDVLKGYNYKSLREVYVVLFSDDDKKVFDEVFNS